MPGQEEIMGTFLRPLRISVPEKQLVMFSLAKSLVMQAPVSLATSPWGNEYTVKSYLPETEH